MLPTLPIASGGRSFGCHMIFVHLITYLSTPPFQSLSCETAESTRFSLGRNCPDPSRHSSLFSLNLLLSVWTIYRNLLSWPLSFSQSYCHPSHPSNQASQLLHSWTHNVRCCRWDSWTTWCLSKWCKQVRHWTKRQGKRREAASIRFQHPPIYPVMIACFVISARFQSCH